MSPMKKIILTTLIIFQFNISQAWQEFHGGDITLIQSTLIANNLISDIEKIPTLEYITPYLLEGLFKTEIISTSHDLILNGQKKVALVTKFNADMNGSIKLEINSGLWSKLSDNEKNLLMMHELLNLTTFTDDDYSDSNTYLSKILLYRQITEQNKITLKQFILSGFKKCSLDNLKKTFPLILTTKYIGEIEFAVNDNSNEYCESVVTKFNNMFDSILK